MAFRIHRGIWQFQKPDGAYESKYKLNDSGQLVETDTEGNETGGMTASVSWTSISGRPTALSGFTNDLGNYGGWLSTSGKAADSETVDGVDSSRIVYGSNERRSTRYDQAGIVSPNQNSGFYYGNNPDGAPFDEWWNWLTVAGASWTSGNNYDFKLAHNFHNDDFYVSRMTNGTQYSWRRIIDSGNIGSQSVNYASTAGNSSTTSQTSFSSLSTGGGLRDSLNRRFVVPGGGSYATSTSVITGAIRIKLPTQGSGMMMTCTAKVYEYSLSKSFTITFGGHRDGNNWYNQFCYIDGDTNRGNLTVRFGVSGGRDCVWIGETNSSWSYPQVFITDIQIGYTAIDSRWASDWIIDFVTSFDTINRTSTAYAKITNANIGDQSVNYAASAGNADTVDGWHRDDLRAWGNLTGVPSTFSPSAHTHAISDVTGLQTALDGKQAAGSYLTTSGKAADSNLLDGIDSSGFQRQIDESIVNIVSPNASSGTWIAGDADDWGTPRIGSIAARYNDGTGYLQFNVPAGMDSAYVSHLTWNSGGYVDCYGVQADGGLVFLRRINTRQSIENSNEGSNGGNPNQHDGTTISLVGTGLSSFSAVRLQNRVGRFHLTGMSFTSAKLQGTEGTGMVHPGQLSVSGSGSGLDADLLDGNHASAFYLATNPSGYITGSYLDDYTRGAYRVISDYGGNTTWYLRSNGQFVFATGHDWTVSFRLSIDNGSGYGNNGSWAYFGQQDSNSTNGTWRGVRIRKYAGGNVDGDLSAGAFYIGDTRKDLLWDTAYNWGNHAGLYAAASHTHSIANVTGLQGALDGKQAAGSYLTSLPAHTHDDRYYTESESDTRFATAAQGAKADSALQSLPAHTHDDRYYTESESLSLFARKDTNSAIEGNLVIGNGTYGNSTPYGNSGARLMFSGSNSDAQGNYYIGTNHEDYGGNYSKLDLRWHTGIRMGAQPGYGGIRFYNNEDFDSRLMSIGESDANVRIDNNLWIGGAGGWITDLLAGKQASGSYAAASHTHTIANVTGLQAALDDKQAAGSYAASSHTHDYVPLAGGTMSGTLTLKNISGVSQTVPNSYGAYLHLGGWGVGRTAATAVLVNTAYRADYATDLWDMNISRFTNNSGYITAYGAQGANGNFYIDDNYGYGIVGLYSDTRYQGVFAMGDAYKLSANGTSAGSLYGIAWTHSNIGGESKSGLGHQALFMMNGRTYTAIGSGIWTDGTITTTSHGNSSQWNTAYGWGNHASAGYQAASSAITTSNIGSQSVAYADRARGFSGYPHASYGMMSFYNWGGSNGGTSEPNDGSYTVGISVGSHPNDQAYGFQIGRNMWNDGLWTRGYDSGWREWVRLIDSTNIGSQSVSYAASAGAVAWDSVSGKPSTFAPSSHTHSASEVGLGNVSNAAQVTTSYNSSLNSDSRNSRGVTRLYRRDDNSDYSVQAHWTGSHWWLRGYGGDSFHAEARVGYADSAGTAGSASSASSASSATTAVNLSGGNVTTSGNNLYIQNGGANNYRIHHTGDIGVFDVTSRFSIREMSSIWSATRYQWGNYMSHAWFDVDPWGDNWGIGGNPVDWKTVNRGSFLTFGFEDWSDRRHKSAIVEIDNAVDKVKAISGYTYWKRGSKVREAGVIAQDVLAVLPEAVGGTEEGYSVKPAALIGLLMKAVKEQQETIDALTARIEALENK